ncbi:MAG: hypothetical protein CM15mP128_1910 [Methanobacteriota archaeon]|nr:MAG: hypothetical protein CM15mP128_1910 [Euryarchaeota archaeon]
MSLFPGPLSSVGLAVRSTIGTTFYTFGGDPILFQHLFWFFGHPEVYVVIVPAFGIVSEVLATSARRSVFGYKSMVIAMAGIGVVGFVVWGHHMLTSGMSPAWRAAFMITTMLVAIPTGAKIFNWLMTLYQGSLVMRTHTLWALGFLITFTLGGISGMFFPSPVLTSTSTTPTSWSLTSTTSSSAAPCLRCSLASTTGSPRSPGARWTSASASTTSSSVSRPTTRPSGPCTPSA